MKKKKSVAKSKPKPKMKASPKPKKGTAGTDDIISLILRDHEPIKKLIKSLSDIEIEIEKKRPLFLQFEKVLTQHAKAEEESLYVHMKEEDDLCIEGLEGDTEHAIAEQLMAEIGEIKNDDDLWMAKVKVLAEIVDHHVKEEEGEIFKQVRKEFDQSERIEIGKEYVQQFNMYSESENAPKVRPLIEISRQGFYV